MVLLITVVALAAPLLSPFDPTQVQVDERLHGPCQDNLMGTDGYGRDILSRIIYGARFSLSLSLAVVAANMVLGLLIGSTAGYLGGMVDEFIMRTVDLLMAFPGIILALCIVGVLGPSMHNLFIALVALGWVGYARIARGLVLSLKEQCFIDAARGLGGSGWYIIVYHVIPNIVPSLIILAAMHVGHAILAIASLSFLGLGVQPPTPEWGTMLNEGKQFIFTHPHVIFFPGVSVTVTVFAFNILGDGLRDLLDPRARDIIKT
ncbi:peptide/nickel transport system permease protein [Desulfotomaculum arcticum]|uniref:Peptide/nickel transport system permease protein n=2 Tax=Desulfotruncus TaxID=2867377 RepID=A0A1I2XRY8_9FIRM|nr:peptide/nickel transport system permease protein [Desulfotomaculum arcticum] [Desulfotruncus arcticus DSM 17038]